ncbi:zinc-binding metallopeptidase family protein [Pseudooceanicola sp. C21-150M6]|uniref:zinc-binding metallopeptidase family protein n=1 Tax=Pseudooceanicola sp. C21-150M6 TaxID=3434355 RepID=UPI003D7F4933
MRIFQCPACGQRLYFENSVCGACGAEVSYDPERRDMVAGGAGCTNRGEIGCNWVAEARGLCRSCGMTETVPDLRAAENRDLWAWTEASKRWLLANLSEWGWFMARDAGARPLFRLLSEKTAAGAENVVMGHADGVITINVSEAGEAEVTRRREELGELYRTMLGHMRHEMAHFLFLRLAEDAEFLPAFRALFGDERADYGDALKRHYARPGQAGSHYVTSYASAHPHEDWAETTAHLLHLIDLLDSAQAVGLTLGAVPAYAVRETEHLIRQAIDVSIAANHVNRAMEVPDLYPFVLGQGVAEKMAFVHGWLRRGVS